MRGRLLALGFLTSGALHAQSVRLESNPSRQDSGDRPAAHASQQAEPTARPEPDGEEGQLTSASPPITPPQVTEAQVSYPQDARGNAQVELELLISSEGEVLEAEVIVGKPPFAEAARAAARHFRFLPATRGGKPVSARVRFLVTFEEPSRLEEDPAGSSSQQPSETTTPRAEPRQGHQEPPEPALEVLVLGERKGLSRQLGRADVQQLPGAFGDPFRAIEVLPGVTPLVSGLPYFYVRGAPPGNIGYLFDGIVVPTLYHFGGGPGVLHPSLIDQVDLYAGAYPAKYGRYAGGLVVGTLQSPGTRARGEVSVRALDSGAMVETPFANGRGHFLAAGRYSYTALLLSLVLPETTIQYWDYQTRTRYEIDDDDSVELLWFGSSDYVTSETQTGESMNLVDLTFHRADLRWKHQLPKGHIQQAIMLGLDKTGGGSNGEVIFDGLLAGSRTNLFHRFSKRSLLTAGLNVLVERHQQNLVDSTLDPASDVSGSNNTFGLGFDEQRTDITSGIYAEFTTDLTSRTELSLGLRADLFVSGNKFAVGIDPRILARFHMTEQLTIVHGLGLVHQGPSFVLPFPGLKPNLTGGLQKAVQHTAGVEFDLPADIESSAMFFQNLFFDMTDLFGVTYLGASDSGIIDAANLSDLRRTNGRSVGMEISLRRSLTQRLGGFLSYTLARSERYSGRLAGPAGSDRTHVFNLAASYDLGKHWRLGGRVAAYSGVPAWIMDGSDTFGTSRTTPFWRLDWRLQKRWPSKDGRRYWGLVFEVLNTTLNKEAVQRVCREGECQDQFIGPITIPNIGLEAAF